MRFPLLCVLLAMTFAGHPGAGYELQLPQSGTLNGLPHVQLPFYSRRCARLYFMVPKAGSMTVRTALGLSATARSIRNCHFKLQQLSQIAPSDLSELEVKAFTFVRDPLSRFIALYNYIHPVGEYKADPAQRDAVCTWGCETQWSGLPNAHATDPARPAPRYPYLPSEGEAEPGRASYEREVRGFVGALERALRGGALAGVPALEHLDRRLPGPTEPPRDAPASAAAHCSDDYQEGTLINWHWSPQVYNLPWEPEAQGLEVDNRTYVGKLEEFDRHWSVVWRQLLQLEELGEPRKVQRENKGLDLRAGDAAAGGGGPPRWKCSYTFANVSRYCKPILRREYLDRESVQAVCRMYMQDYAAFGYQLPPECRHMDLARAREATPYGRSGPEAPERTWRGVDYSEADVRCIQRNRKVLANRGLYRMSLRNPGVQSLPFKR